MSNPPTIAMQVQEIGKTFGHVEALKDVSFSVNAGEVLAILGDNGAGKSTLIKILSGVYDADEGQLEVNGQAVDFHKPSDASDAGIATVYQDLALVDTRDVAANIFLGREFTKGPFVDRKRMYEQARAEIDKLSLKLPSVKVPVGLLSGGQRQAVAIVRAASLGARIIIMDEPTAALGVTESARVMELAERLRNSGLAVVIISHNLQQIWPVADRFLVMRLGRVAGVRAKSETSVDGLIKLIMHGDMSEGTQN